MFHFRLHWVRVFFPLSTHCQFIHNQQQQCRSPSPTQQYFPHQYPPQFPNPCPCPNRCLTIIHLHYPIRFPTNFRPLTNLQFPNLSPISASHRQLHNFPNQAFHTFHALLIRRKSQLIWAAFPNFRFPNSMAKILAAGGAAVKNTFTCTWWMNLFGSVSPRCISKAQLIAGTNLFSLSLKTPLEIRSAAFSTIDSIATSMKSCYAGSLTSASIPLSKPM